MKLVVCGGAGYIGAHMCKLLAESGHQVAVLDDLSTGHREAVRWGELFVGDIGDERFVGDVFERFPPDGVLHFAARSLVGESVQKPREYWRNNVVATLGLLDQVSRRPGCVFVFSSTAAIFGLPRTALIDETHACEPINTYGRTKLAIEATLRDYWTAYRVPSVAFRYFNAAGAAPGAGIGESHTPETHLIPNVLESLLGRCGALQVFGDDYSTPDGTCTRDYVHVDDLCRAHLLGLDFLTREPGAHQFNLGNGAGFSVREVIASAERVTRRKLDFEIASRRSGDPPSLVADSARAAAILGWQPRYRDLDRIVETAWDWHRDRRY